MTDQTTPAPADSPLRQRIAEAVQDGPTWMLPKSLAEEIADNVVAVRDRYVEQLEAGRATWKAKAEEIERDRDRLAGQVDQLIARLGEYADRAISNGERAERAEAALAQPAPAHDAGPSVAEAKADDRRWWNGEKAGE